MNRSLVLIPVIAALVLTGIWFSRMPDALVVYCAHDAEYAQQILEEFSKKTGIRVEPRYDTEATKSLGLINLILRERNIPRCDVFWNNELLGMVELREQNVLEPYRGPGWERIPAKYRDDDGYWAGFAARMRVYLFNTQKTSASDEALLGLMANDPASLAIAKPVFGSTLTHYTVMWHLWGPEKVKAWHSDLVQRGLRVVNGNAAVKDVVAMGTCQAGLTDTDDAFVAIDDGYPVEMRPARVGSSPPNSAQTSESSDQKSYTICFPNTVAIIKGTKKKDASAKLVDYLLSAEAELALAKAKSRQIPLGPINEQELPDDVRNLILWSHDGIDLRSLLPERRECLKWLQEVYLK